MQCVEAVRIARAAVDLMQGFLCETPHFRIMMDEPLQTFSERRNRAPPLPHKFAIRGAVRRKIAQPRKNVAQLRLLYVAGDRFKDQRNGLWIEGQYFVVILDVEVILAQGQAKMTGFQLSAVLVAQGWQQDFVVEFRLEGIPVDIEELGKL